MCRQLVQLLAAACCVLVHAVLGLYLGLAPLQTVPPQMLGTHCYHPRRSTAFAAIKASTGRRVQVINERHMCMHWGGVSMPTMKVKSLPRLAVNR